MNVSFPAPSQIDPSMVAPVFSVTVALPAPSSISRPWRSMIDAPLLRLISTGWPADARVMIAAWVLVLFTLLPGALSCPPTSILVVPVPSCLA